MSRKTSQLFKLFHARSLVCDPDDTHEYYKQNPCQITEVPSPTTQSIDRREKLHAYQTIPSVKEYLLVSQESKQIELYRRDKKHWQYTLLNNDADILQLSCLDLEMTMPEIYEDVL